MVELAKPRYFSLRSTVLSHGWVNLSPFRWSRSALHGAIDADGEAADYRIAEKGDRIVVTTRPVIDASRLERIVPFLERALSFDFPVDGLLAACEGAGRQHLAAMVRAGWGRLLRGLTPWEDAVKTLFTTNCTWANTQRMTRGLCETLGKRTPSGNFTFPGPASVAAALGDEPPPALKLGYRTRYLTELARRAASGDIDLPCLEHGKGGDREAIRQSIQSLKGFGSYAVNHLLVLYGWYGSLPVDREVAGYLGLDYRSIKGEADYGRHFAEFGDFRFIAYKLERIRQRKNWIGD